MSNTITITYNYNTDETKIRQNPLFKELPLIHQLDAIQDGLHLLTELYEEKLREFSNPKAHL